MPIHHPVFGLRETRQDFLYSSKHMDEVGSTWQKEDPSHRLYCPIPMDPKTCKDLTAEIGLTELVLPNPLPEDFSYGILCPINLGKSHWTSLGIHLSKNKSGHLKVHLGFSDSINQSNKLPNWLKDGALTRLHALFSSIDPKLEWHAECYAHRWEQDDSYACGPYSLENGRRFLAKKGQETNPGPQAIREKQVLMMSNRGAITGCSTSVKLDQILTHWMKQRKMDGSTLTTILQSIKAHTIDEMIADYAKQSGESRIELAAFVRLQVFDTRCQVILTPADQHLAQVICQLPATCSNFYVRRGNELFFIHTDPDPEKQQTIPLNIDIKRFDQLMNPSLEGRRMSAEDLIKMSSLDLNFHEAPLTTVPFKERIQQLYEKNPAAFKDPVKRPLPQIASPAPVSDKTFATRDVVYGRAVTATLENLGIIRPIQEAIEQAQPIGNDADKTLIRILAHLYQLHTEQAIQELTALYAAKPIPDLCLTAITTLTNSPHAWKNLGETCASLLAAQELLDACGQHLKTISKSVYEVSTKMLEAHINLLAIAIKRCDAKLLQRVLYAVNDFCSRFLEFISFGKWKSDYAKIENIKKMLPKQEKPTPSFYKETFRQEIGALNACIQAQKAFEKSSVQLKEFGQSYTG